MLMQDQTAIAASGDTVINGATNGCGLVIVFDAAGPRAACYHWPGLDAESATNQTKFRNLCKELDSMSRVFILTNGFMEDAQRKQYHDAGCIIRDIFGLETHYYYRDGMMTGDPCVKIGPGNNLTFIEHDVSYTELPL